MKKGGPEFVKRAPEGLSLFKITPPKASSFFAPRGAMCVASKVGLSAPLLERAAEFSAGRPQRICQEGVPLYHIHGLLEGFLDLNTNIREDVELLMEAISELHHT